MKANSGIYKIEKGQKMVGSCHLAQRDRKVFGVPGCKDVDEFDPSRFNAKVSDSVVTSHASLLKINNLSQDFELLLVILPLTLVVK